MTKQCSLVVIYSKVRLWKHIAGLATTVNSSDTVKDLRPAGGSTSNAERHCEYPHTVA